MKIINFLTIIFFFLFILTSQEPMCKQTERGGSNRLNNRNTRKSRNLKMLGMWKVAWGGKWKWEMFQEKLRFSNFCWKIREIFLFWERERAVRREIEREFEWKLASTRMSNDVIAHFAALFETFSSLFLARFRRLAREAACCCVTSNGTLTGSGARSSDVNSSPNNNKYLNCCSLWNLLKDLVCVSFKEFSYEKLMHVCTIHIIGDFISCLKNVYSLEDSFTVSA